MSERWQLQQEVPGQTYACPLTSAQSHAPLHQVSLILLRELREVLETTQSQGLVTDQEDTASIFGFVSLI